jgi:hypothetical protein
MLFIRSASSYSYRQERPDGVVIAWVLLRRLFWKEVTCPEGDVVRTGAPQSDVS